MRTAVIRGHAREPSGDASVVMSRPRWPVAIGALVTSAWLLVVATYSVGAAGSLHHHALIEGGPPAWMAVPLFAGAWLVMVAAMMLPASLPALHAFARSPRGVRAWAAYLAADAGVWLAFGLLAFAGDVVLHRAADTTPVLAANRWIIDAVLLAGAGAYQLSPWKRRGLAACRHPGLLDAAPSEASAGRLGLSHGLDCLRSSWALMLLMFAAGVANLWWMVVLTLLMVYEATGTRGRSVASIAGVALLMAALLVVSTGSILV